jgi:hypothetical protein
MKKNKDKSFLEFHARGYYLSTDYDVLWNMIQSGSRVAAWLCYSNEYEEPIWDIVEVKNTFMEKDDYSIGTRGIGYESIKKNKEWFISVCRDYSLHYIVQSYEPQH